MMMTNKLPVRSALDRKQKFYIWLTAIFVAALITSDLIGAKYFRIAGIDLSVGMIPFPLTFLLTDIVNEFYGTEGARRLTFVGLGMAVFVFAIINLAIALIAVHHFAHVLLCLVEIDGG